MNGKHIAIIGGGAAGCMAAIEIKRRLPHTCVTVYEAGNRLLAKVSITGGGRCNLTNSFEHVSSTESVYPRGARLMKHLFCRFGHQDTCRWFEAEGVRLVTQDDGCIFPQSQNAMEIVETLTSLLRKLNVELRTGHRLQHIVPQDNAYKLSFKDRKEAWASKVVVAIGGTPKAESLHMFEQLGVETVVPVPSLFSFCLPMHPLKPFMGTVVEDVTVSITGTRIKARGPLLVTHWGISGPAILKLSSFGARLLYEKSYRCHITINWLGGANEQTARDKLSQLANLHPRKLASSAYPSQFNSRLWAFFLQNCGVTPETRWNGIDKKQLNRLVALLTGHTLEVNGKNPFKEEFVTCGGIALSSINPNTLECRTQPNLFFAGEVLDVDAVTGGFNLQAAWTMGYSVAQAVTLQDTN